MDLEGPAVRSYRRCLNAEAVRRRLRLNKGEASNNLRKAVFFNRLGQIRDRAYESQLHRARGLNLLVAAIVLWNSRYLGEAVVALRRHGYDVPDQILALVWPLAWDHINLTGDYTWSGNALRDPDRLRDLRLDQLTPPLPLHPPLPLQRAA